MKRWMGMTAIAALIFGLSACGGDKQQSADQAAEVQKAIQEGMQREKAMIEGMQKGAEGVEKQVTGQKEETKK